MENATTNSAEPKQKKKLSPAIIILPIVIGIVAFVLIKNYIHGKHYETTDNAQIESNAVPVVTRIAGFIDTLNISDYQDVKAGQLLLTIDNREYEIALQQAEADLLSAEADLATAQSNYINAQESKSVANANYAVQKIRSDKAANDYNRDAALYKDQSITQKQLDDSKTNNDASNKQTDVFKQQINLADAQLNTTQSQIKKAEATIQQRKAALEQAQLKLTYTKVYAPVSGKIGKKNLDAGQYIQQGQNLFTIVNNEAFWVTANFKETQIEHLSEGQEVIIEIDGYPHLNVTGKIVSLSDATGAKFALLPPDNASGNFIKVAQRVPVKIEIENIAEVQQYLKAGLSVTAEVKIK
jgi:membrane fusion protein, multidrug efflux system